MVTEKAKEFFRRIETDPKTRELMSGMKEPKNEKEFVENCRKLASQMGIELTDDELRDVVDAMKQNRRQKTDTKIRTLQAEELKSATGGVVWNGEEAPDGHEMGCAFAYYNYDYQKYYDIWCKESFYCKEGNYRTWVCDDCWQ